MKSSFIETDRQIYKRWLLYVKRLIPWWKGFEELELDIEEPCTVEDMVETYRLDDSST